MPAMSPDLRRRTFLTVAGKAVLGMTAATAAGCGRPEPAPIGDTSITPATLVADLEQLLPRWMDEAMSPGLAIGLVRDGRLFWQRGFGVADRDTGTPISDATIFEVGSMSKPVFACVVLQLHEAGVLDLDTPLITYMPGRFVAADARADLITARHVLSHTSGLPNWRSGDEPLALQFAPGDRWSYSGEAYYYLQSVVTHLTGRLSRNVCGTYEGDLEVCASDIDAFMKARLLVPLGMTSSGYVWNTTLASRSARPHDAKGLAMRKAHPNAADAARYASAGGLHTTIGDYARFMIGLLDSAPGGGVRLRAETIDMMARPVVPVSERPRRSSWALGWQVLHTTAGNVIAHGGDNPGFHAFAAASRATRSGFLIMTNGDGGTKVIESVISEPGLMDRLVGTST
jgi:CubicO group peptidase (beta-lactamase class C family)